MRKGARGFRGGLTVFVLLAISCGSPGKIIRQASSPVRPEWVDHPRQDPEKVFFVGICSGAETLEAGQESAAKDAASKIAQYIGSEVRVESRDLNSQVEQTIVRQITARSSVKLSGFRAEELYYEKISRVEKRFSLDRYDVYVLASYSRKAAQEERSRLEKKDHDSALRALKRYRAAGRSIARRDYWPAVQNCLGVLRLIGDLRGEVRTGDPVITDVSVLREHVQERLAQARSGWRRFKPEFEFKSVAGNPGGSFQSSLLGALSKRGFLSDHQAPSLSLSGHVAIVRGEDLAGSSVYSAEGSLSFVRLSDRKTMATVAVQGKGLHDDPSLAALNAASDAGQTAGEELAAALEKLERRYEMGRR